MDLFPKSKLNFPRNKIFHSISNFHSTHSNKVDENFQNMWTQIDASLFQYAVSSRILQTHHYRTIWGSGCTLQFAVAENVAFKCPARKLWINFQACTAIITKNKQDEPRRAPAAPTAARRQPRPSASQNATRIDVRNTPTDCLWLRRYIMGGPCNDDASPATASKVRFLIGR